MTLTVAKDKGRSKPDHVHSHDSDSDRVEQQDHTTVMVNDQPKIKYAVDWTGKNRLTRIQIDS